MALRNSIPLWLRQRPPLSPQELCEGIQKSHCARLYQCATTPEAQAALKSLFANQDDCIQQGLNMQKPVCSLWTEDNVCGSFGGSAWNGATARTCLEDLDAQGCAFRGRRDLTRTPTTSGWALGTATKGKSSMAVTAAEVGRSGTAHHGAIRGDEGHLARRFLTTS